jgi:hypothetical protein
MRTSALTLVLASLCACVEQIPDHVELLPLGANVELAAEPPSPNAYALVGQVTGQGAANDPDVAQQAATNDMRNKAAALGASIVIIDESLGEALPLQDKTKVKVLGRAYKAID